MRRLLVSFLLVLLAAPLWGQGRTDAPNYEEVHVKPITVARVNGHDYLLVCNTPDNSVEIYDTVGNTFLMRIPVGQGPVSVVYRNRLKRFYTANFLGDSISMVKLDASTGTLNATFEQTVSVPDEPWYITFYTQTLVQPIEPQAAAVEIDDAEPQPTTRETLIVTHQTPDYYGWYDALTLAPVSAGSDRLHAEVPIDLDGDGTPDVDLALKEPRTAAVTGDDLVIIATKGGNGIYDNDIYCRNLKTNALRQHGQVGSSNLNMRFDRAGNLFIVGGFALNEQLFDEPVVAAAPTGFVRSELYLARDVCSDAFSVESRDLNEDATAVPPVPVAFGQALAQPTDVLLFNQGGTLSKVFVAAFSSDRIGVLQANFAQPLNQWAINRINTPPVAGNPMTGPRAMALKRANASTPNDPGDRLYVLNRLDHSVTVIDPITETVVPGASFALANDPLPAWVRLGQQFLFGAQFSGNGFSSCASCHIDARTDRLAWDLGDPDQAPVPLPQTLLDGPSVTEWPADKGLMVTQTLQGLINWEVEQEAQRVFTNAPYHWRADRNDLDNFNPAFVSLLGRSAELTDDEMAAFKEYVFSIFYPPNPKQGLEREFTGDFGPLDLANDMTVGTGAQHGMKIYMMGNSDGRTCSECHALPEGSNNLITEVLGGQPMEVAALRHIFQREARVDKGRATLPSDAPFSGITGLIHTGFVPSPFDQPPFNEIDVNAVATIDAFNRLFFSGRFCAFQGDFCPDLQDLNAFTHELDTGTGPVVGLTTTIDRSTSGSTFTTNMLNLMEGQVKAANAGLAVQAWIGGNLTGYWYDASGATAGYRPEPFSATTITRAALLGLLVTSSDRLVVHATPLGAQRRVAAPSGVASALPAQAPSDLAVQPWRANTAYDTVPLMTQNWGLGAQFYVHMVQVLQHALLQDAASQGAFGLTGLRHEAPRRGVIAGRDIQQGAVLEVYLPNDPNGVNTNLPPSSGGQVNTVTIRVALPIYPTDEVDSAGRRLWQTAVELAPLNLYKHMVGGDQAPGVQALLNDTGQTISKPPPVGMFDPLNWGWAYYVVVNPGGQQATAGWQRILLF